MKDLLAVGVSRFLEVHEGVRKLLVLLLDRLAWRDASLGDTAADGLLASFSGDELLVSVGVVLEFSRLIVIASKVNEWSRNDIAFFYR